MVADMVAFVASQFTTSTWDVGAQELCSVVLIFPRQDEKTDTTERQATFRIFFLGPSPLRGSFFLENGTLRDTREKNPEIGSKNLT